MQRYLLIQAAGLDVDHGPETFGDTAKEDKDGQEESPDKTAMHRAPEKFEITPELDKESVFHKFQRLRLEVATFVDDIDKQKRATMEEEREAEATPMTLQTSLAQLTRQLEELTYEDKNRPHLSAVDVDVDGSSTLANKMISDIKGYSGEPGASGEGAQYDLYYSRTNARFVRFARVTQMDHHIHELERLVGKTDLNSRRDLQKTLATLDKKLTALDNDGLKALLARLDASKMALEAAGMGEVDDDEETTVNYEGVDSLHLTMTKWDPVALQVPSIVERLKALRPLHEEAAGFGNNLRRVDLAQGELTNSEQIERSLLEQMSESLKVNLVAIDANCTALEERMERLQEDIKKL